MFSRQGGGIFSGSYCNSKPRKCACLACGEDGEVVGFLAVLTVILSRKGVSVSWVTVGLL